MIDCKNKIEKEETISLIDKSICEITGKVAKLDIVRISDGGPGLTDCSSLLLKTSGDYSADLILTAEDEVLRAITRNMKRQKVISEEDIVVYTTEYHNMLCGYFVSHFNHKHELKARFGIPVFVKGCHIYGDTAVEPIQLLYECTYGRFGFEATGLPITM